MAFMDNGPQINIIMPGYIENHSLDFKPTSDPVGGSVACVGLGNGLTGPIGYGIIWVQ